MHQFGGTSSQLLSSGGSLIYSRTQLTALPSCASPTTRAWTQVLLTEFAQLSAELPPLSARQEGFGLAIVRQGSSSVTLVPIL